MTLSEAEGDRDRDEGHPNPTAESTRTDFFGDGVRRVAHAPSTSLSLSEDGDHVPSGSVAATEPPLSDATEVGSRTGRSGRNRGR